MGYQRRVHGGTFPRRASTPVPAAQAVRQALLLRLLRYPLQGGKEQVARVEKGQNSATEVWIPESSAAAGTSPWWRSRWWTPWCSWSSWWTTKDVLSPLSLAPFWGLSILADDGGNVLVLNFRSVSG